MVMVVLVPVGDFIQDMAFKTPSGQLSVKAVTLPSCFAYPCPLSSQQYRWGGNMH